MEEIIGSSEYLWGYWKISVLHQLGKSSRFQTPKNTINSTFKEVYISLCYHQLERRVASEPNRSCPLQQLSFLDWFPFAKPVVFYIVGLLRCFTILVTFQAVVFPHSSWLANQFFLWKDMFEIYIHIWPFVNVFYNFVFLLSIILAFFNLFLKFFIQLFFCLKLKVYFCIDIQWSPCRADALLLIKISAVGWEKENVLIYKRRLQDALSLAC